MFQTNERTNRQNGGVVMLIPKPNNLRSIRFLVFVAEFVRVGWFQSLYTTFVHRELDFAWVPAARTPFMLEAEMEAHIL